MKHRFLLGAFAGVLALPTFGGAPLRAEWRSSITGGRPILPPRFVPMRFTVEKPAVPLRPAAIPGADQPIVWSMPLVDRELSAAEKADPLDSTLLEAMLRIEPVFDPSRLDGNGAPPPMAVSPGTASMNNVFADRWTRASPDPNVNAKVHAIAMAWQPDPARACDGFSKMRTHGWGDPALTNLSEEDCALVIGTRATRRWDQPPVPLTAAWISVPIFAAPLPGARMSSQDFWAARRAKILEIQARLHQKWDQPAPDGAPTSVLAAGLRP